MAQTFSADLESLQSLAAPDWFRDAKFGIWSHWGPQAVPRQGDWYARRMYIEGDKHYQHHLETYGHPSQQGFKDIIPLWRAEKFDPDALMELYVQAGAKYFVSMGVHHDNFDLWNSKHHKWNAVQMGPMRDIVGDWKAAAQKYGLPFGVSEHLGASYNWFASSHGADQTGPLVGVPYDGENPTFADLYHPSGPMNERQHVYESIMADKWYSPNPQWSQTWLKRIEDLLDNYQPDLLYTDGGVPFGDVGREMVAHFFNVNAQKHGGKCQAVYNHKMFGSGDFFPELSVTDVERGSIAAIQERPWQCDTSIGDWYYSDGFPYKTTTQIIHQLVDVVSKNGTMLLNVVQYPDGSLPPEPQQFLREMAAWMPVNGEAIYGTRPWKTFGEGPTTMETGHFKENFPFTPADFRFTTKNDVVYAISLGIPTETVVIKSLASGSGAVTGEPTSVTLLGFKGQLKWNRTAQGLEIQLPEISAFKHALAFKISGLKTVPGYVAPPTVAVAVDKTVSAQPNGDLVLLPARAELHGEGLQVQGSGADANIGYWDAATEWVSWDKVRVAQPGTYRLTLETATLHPSSDFSVEIGNRKISAKALVTGDWNTFTSLELGEIEIPAGTIAVNVRPTAATWQAMNLRAIRLTKVK